MSARNLTLVRSNNPDRPLNSPYWQPRLTWLVRSFWLVAGVAFILLIYQYFLELNAVAYEIRQYLVELGWGAHLRSAERPVTAENWTFSLRCFWDEPCRQVYRKLLYAYAPPFPWLLSLATVVGGLLAGPICKAFLRSVGSVVTVARYRRDSYVGVDEPIPAIERVGVDTDWGYHYLGTRAQTVGQAGHLTPLTLHKRAHLLLLGNSSDLWRKYFLPTMLHSARWGNSVIVIDPWASVQRAERIGTLFHRKGFDPQIFLLGFDTETMHMHLLEGVDRLEVASEVAQLLISELGEKAQLERDLLTRLLMHLAQRGPVTLGDAYRYLTRPEAEVERDLARLLTVAWENPTVQRSIYQNVADRLQVFAHPLLDDHVRPAEDARLNVKLGTTEQHRVFVYAGVASQVPGSRLASRLVWHWLSRQLSSHANDLINPIFMLPFLETYGHLPDLAKHLKSFP